MKSVGSFVAIRNVFVVVALICVAWGISAQVFPELEYVDILRLTDGSVLKGHVVEDRTSEYMIVEIYGGSRFFVLYENIESRSVQRNPDYGTEYLRLTIGDFERPGGESEAVQISEDGARWPDPLWVWPIMLGFGGVTPTTSFDGFIEAGGLRKIGTSSTYLGLMAHAFFQFPIPFPYPAIGYGENPETFLANGGFLVLPPGVATDSWIYSGVVGVSIRRITISAYFAAFDGAVNSIGIGGGYLF